MKIEDSPFPNRSPVEKLRANSLQTSFEFALDELDMSFLELLDSINTKADARNQASLPGVKADAGLMSGKAPVSESKKVVRLPVPEKAAISAKDEGEFNTAVDADMVLKPDDLTLLDIQYLKQEVIPGLPILVGQVPFNTVFPTGGDGEISYKGFDVSPKLSELIEKGFKTGRPIRVELDATSALVLKIRNGQVSAEFVSADRAAAFAVQQQLDELRNRMTARNLPVGTLEYKYQNPRQNHKQGDEETPSRSE
ncbi:flagellar hook-length control protein FliK [Vampirovibrio chlorellavorus]|uniref:flagellar hook-length control protein FliK n=1 Tax=Vampirovibrio chlorellavorus TaxID=758823 RepID=UPI0026EF1649|nr:flagellar hook-length control protein FliK [Vampirovibrio chlorellavorus]